LSNSNEPRLKTLYMVWPQALLDAPLSLDVPDGYRLRVFRDSDRAGYFRLVSQEEDWLKSPDELNNFLKLVLPDGLFLVEEVAKGEIVATAGAIHNPQGGSYHFPGGGELALVLVKPGYRRQGLGKLVCKAAINCFIEEGYTSIRLGVRPDNAGAIRLYLGVGFQPFIYSPEMPDRWEALLAGMGWPVEPNQWSYTTS